MIARRGAVKPTLPLLVGILAVSAAAPVSGAPPPAAPPPEAVDPAELEVVPYRASDEIEEMALLATRGQRTTRDKLESIVHHIFDHRSLGFEYASHPTLTAIEAFERRRGNCLSLVNLFVTMARAAEIRAVYIEVEDFETFERRADSVVRSTHVVGGVAFGRELRTIDFMPNRPKTYRRLRILSDREATAHYFNAIGAEALLAGDPDRAEVLLRRALELDPELVEGWNNLALTARRSGRLDEAIADLEHALELEPDFVSAIANLSGYYRLAGDEPRAEAAAERALALKTKNPYYLVMQGRTRLRDGDLAEAEELARRARRLDKRIPEVYLLLGRVELARGDADRAEHWFARARRLGTDYPDRYRRGLQTKIDRLLASSL